MLPAKFEYTSPETLENAVKDLFGDQKAQVLAGSFSLIAAIKKGEITPSLLVDIKKIPGLRDIEVQPDNSLKIGGMTSYAEIANSSLLKQDYGILAEVAESIGDPQIRNWEKVGDIFAYRALSSSFLSAALVSGAKFELTGVEGSRTVSTEDFIELAYKSQWLTKDIITSISFDSPAYRTGYGYQFINHPASGEPICAVVAKVELDEERAKLINTRIALAGAISYPIRLSKLESACASLSNPDDVSKLFVGDITADLSEHPGLRINSDQYASADYRLHLVGVLTKRALAIAIARAKLTK